MSKRIPLLITAISGLVVIVGEYFTFAQHLGVLTFFNTWFQTASALAFPLGLISLTRIHIGHVRRKRASWMFSAVLLVVTYGYLVASLVSGPGPNGIMNWFFQAYITPAGATLFAMPVFLITSAAFRVFYFRRSEVSLLIVGALFTMLAIAPIGSALVAGWGPAGTWLQTIPANAAFRAIALGAYLGGFATAIRVLLGIERSHIGGFTAAAPGVGR